jgi:aldose 1-epimerase
VCDYGATLVALEVPDRDGEPGRGGARIRRRHRVRDAHEQPVHGGDGRARREPDRRRTLHLDGTEYVLHANEGENHLHGGRQTSFDRMLWDVVAADGQHAVFRHVSPAGDAGYPGTLTVDAEFAVAPSELTITYRATTDARTPVAMTQHAYFNLAGEHGTTIDDHVLTVDASAWTPVDAALIPTGEIADVAGSPFDLRAGRRLGEGIAALGDAGLGDGYDHNLWLDGGAGHLRDVAVLSDPASGRRMVLASDQPCLQVYTGNRLGRATGRGGVVFPVHGGVCLEPQHAPDSVHRPAWPSIVLEPGASLRAPHRVPVHDRLTCSAAGARRVALGPVDPLQDLRPDDLDPATRQHHRYGERLAEGDLRLRTARRVAGEEPAAPVVRHGGASAVAVRVDRRRRGS